MRAFIAKYWKRLIVTDEETERGIRSFWLQFAAGRFPEVKSAAELVRVAEQFTAWHRDGDFESLEHEPPHGVVIPDGCSGEPGTVCRLGR